MQLVSIGFILFIIVLLTLYFVIRKKYQWILLLLFSYIFYMAANPALVTFIVLSTISTFYAALFMGSMHRQYEELLAGSGTMTKIDKKRLKTEVMKQKRIVLTLCILFNIGILIFLKYSNFLIDVVNVFGLSVSHIRWLVIPIGLSFYTLQSIGYTIDVYQGALEPEKNLGKYALFVSFFPQILQGPIGRYETLAPQLVKWHSFDYIQFTFGLQRVLWGLFKKIVLADRLAIFVQMVYSDNTAYSGFIVALATFLYAIQLYADFSGYMDIVIGISQILGIGLSENFDRPYFSKTITQFWRRWHITLGAWFRDYLFYPLMRTRNISAFSKWKLIKKSKFLRNLPLVLTFLILWILIGFWHGASVTFIAYGLYHGFFVIFERITEDFFSNLKTKIKFFDSNPIYQLFRIFKTFVIVCLGYVLFRSSSIAQATTIYNQIFFSFFHGPYGLFYGLMTENFNKTAWFISAVSMLIFLAVSLIKGKTSIREWVSKMRLPVRWAIYMGFIFLVILWGMYGPGYNANSFLYMQF